MFFAFNNRRRKFPFWSFIIILLIGFMIFRHENLKYIQKVEDEESKTQELQNQNRKLENQLKIFEGKLTEYKSDLIAKVTLVFEIDDSSNSIRDKFKSLKKEEEFRKWISETFINFSGYFRAYQLNEIFDESDKSYTLLLGESRQAQIAHEYDMFSNEIIYTENVIQNINPEEGRIAFFLNSNILVGIDTIFNTISFHLNKNNLNIIPLHKYIEEPTMCNLVINCMYQTELMDENILKTQNLISKDIHFLNENLGLIKAKKMDKDYQKRHSVMAERKKDINNLKYSFIKISDDCEPKLK